MLLLQQQQMLLRSKLDRVYEDRLSNQISEDLCCWWCRGPRERRAGARSGASIRCGPQDHVPATRPPCLD